MASSAESGHIESDPKITVPGLGQRVLFAHAGAGRVLAWIEAGHGALLLGAHMGRLPQVLPINPLYNLPWHFPGNRIYKVGVNLRTPTNRHVKPNPNLRTTIEIAI